MMNLSIKPDFENIPIIDFSNFEEKKLREICHNVGFFYLKNSGVRHGLMKEVLEVTKVFFNQQQVEKDSIQISVSPHFRGYGKLGAEITLGVSDYKETFDLGLEQKAADPLNKAAKPYFALLGPNQWPTSESFQAIKGKEILLEYIDSMRLLGAQLLKSMSLSFGLSEDAFSKIFCPNEDASYALLRLLRYPPAQNLEKMGVGPHIDMGCLVLLLQDEIGGLQVQNRKGEWVDAPPIPDTLVINIGKMLQIASNNYFVATPHRVINRGSQIRHSVPFFFEPNLNAEIAPLCLPPHFNLKGDCSQNDPTLRIVYGEEIFRIFQRSFPKPRREIPGGSP